MQNNAIKYCNVLWIVLYFGGAGNTVLYCISEGDALNTNSWSQIWTSFFKDFPSEPCTTGDALNTTSWSQIWTSFQGFSIWTLHFMSKLYILSVCSCLLTIVIFKQSLIDRWSYYGSLQHSYEGLLAAMLWLKSIAVSVNFFIVNIL